MFDFCIVGGGMVGSTLALGLSELGFSIAIIEESQPKKFERSQSPDLRVSAINLASQQLFFNLGIWTHIENMRSCRYKRLSVWDTEKCRTDFSSDCISKTHLGHIIENRIIQLAANNVIKNDDNIQCFWGERVKSIGASEDKSVVRLADDVQIACNILIGADGASSIVRQNSNIGTQGWQYNQQVFAINIKTHCPQQDITWQQFTPDGPLAFLPLYDGYGSLVWYNNVKNVQKLKTLDHEKLKQVIVDAFPADLVDFDIIDTASFPLTRMHANQYVKDNTVLVGDAAHTINPLAGQGVNLGFKDVAVLLQELKEQLQKSGREEVLNQTNRAKWLTPYESKRKRENLLMMSAMDVLYGTFSNDILPLKVVRNIGLKAANHAGPLKTKALKYAVGIA